MNFLEISNANKPVLFLYHAGSGGEFIAKTFSENHSEYITLEYKFNVEKNQYHSVSPILYASQWPAHNDPETWINPHFKPTKLVGLNYVLKDHPTSFNIELYAKHIPNLVTVYLQAKFERKWFARLAFAKLGKKIEAPVTPHFIRTHVNDLLTIEQEHQIIRWSGQFEWIWAHEIMICNSRLAESWSLDDFKHHDSLDKYIKDHIEQDEYYQNTNTPRSPHRFCIDMNIDSLVTDSTPFWDQMQYMFPLLRIDKCIAPTNEWILNNHRLLIKNDK